MKTSAILFLIMGLGLSQIVQADEPITDYNTGASTGIIGNGDNYTWTNQNNPPPTLDNTNGGGGSQSQTNSNQVAQTPNSPVSSATAQAESKYNNAKNAYETYKTQNTDPVTKKFTGDSKKLAELEKNKKSAKNEFESHQDADASVGDKGNRCGNKGGLNCQAAEALNAAAPLLGIAADTLSATNVNKKSADRQTGLKNEADSGTIVSNSKINEVKRADLDQAARNNNLLGSNNMLVGAVQAAYAIAHGSSAKKVAENKKQKEAESQLEVEKLTAEKTIETNKRIAAEEAIKVCVAQDIKCQEGNLANEKIISAAIIKEEKLSAAITKEESRWDQEAREYDAEIAKQKEISGTSQGGAITSLMKGSQHLIEASALKAQKATIIDQDSTLGQTPQFMFNQQMNQGINPGGNAIAPEEVAAITTEDPNANPLDGGMKNDIMPPENNMVAGPQAGVFKETDPSKGGGAGGGGIGGAGGTSASRGDGGGGDGQGSAPGKSQAGGQYATGDGPTSKFSRGSGSGAGVGLSSNFGDLLKKLLPGNDDKKEDKNSLELGASDRSPASDQAAVIGRNKNIFIEISKRYQKKNSEGAVTFQ